MSRTARARTKVVLPTPDSSYTSAILLRWIYGCHSHCPFSVCTSSILISFIPTPFAKMVNHLSTNALGLCKKNWNLVEGGGIILGRKSLLRLSQHYLFTHEGFTKPFFMIK